MAEVDLNAHPHLTTETAYNNLVNNLAALDEDKAAGGPHEAQRPAIKLVAECGFVNGLLASLAAAIEATSANT